MKQPSKQTKVGPSPPEITEDEQWRLVNQSGILKTAIPRAEPAEEHSGDMADEVFNAILLIIPFSFLYLMMDILIHTQYGKHPSPREYVGRLASAIPILSIFIFYTNRHKPRRIMQIGLFLISLAVGSRVIWLVNRASWYVVMRQAPPLATLWIYTIAVLDLLPAVAGLCLLATWVWWSGLKIVF